MEQFYVIVLSAISVLLILMLTFVGVMMYTTKAKNDILTTVCPDYWKYDINNNLCGITVSGGNVSGANGGTLATSNAPENKISYASAIANGNIGYYDGNNYLYIDPNHKNWAKIYSGLTTDCAKNKWATDNGVVWDGYSNNPGC